MTVTVSEQDVDRVAELANLELNAGEKTAMVRDLSLLLNHFAQLNELDTSAVPSELQLAQSGLPQHAAHLRPDQVVPSLLREDVLACAPDTDHIFFKVPKVIER